MTTRYVNSAGSGSADGSDAANAMSYATFTDYMVTGGSFTAAAGDIFLVKLDGTYSRTTTTDAWVNGGTITSPVVVRGYKTTITDGYLGGTGGNGALITTNYPVITYTTGRLNVTGSFIVIENLDIASAASAAAVTINADSLLVRCKVVDSSTNAAAQGILCNNNRAIALDCDATLSGASGAQAALVLNGANSRGVACRVNGGPGSGVRISNSAQLIGCVVYGSALDGVMTSTTAIVVAIIGNTIVGSGGDGIDIITGTTVTQLIYGNLITDNTGYGINGVSADNGIMAAYNRLDRNSAATNLATDWLASTSYGHELTSASQGDEFTAYASQDFSLLITSPAKAAGLFKYMDIGALQRLEPVAAASNVSIVQRRMVR